MTLLKGTQTHRVFGFRFIQDGKKMNPKGCEADGVLLRGVNPRLSPAAIRMSTSKAGVRVARLALFSLDVDTIGVLTTLDRVHCYLGQASTWRWQRDVSDRVSDKGL